MLPAGVLKVGSKQSCLPALWVLGGGLGGGSFSPSVISSVCLTEQLQSSVLHTEQSSSAGSHGYVGVCEGLCILQLGA